MGLRTLHAFLVAIVFGLPPALAQNTPPSYTGDATIQVAEGTTTVATLTATDSDGDDLSWSFAVPAGADESRFTLASSGVLAFLAAKDFEEPDDADGDGSYEVSVRVGDGADTTDQNLTVVLDNVVELTAIRGPAAVTYVENASVRVATYSASSVADQAGVVWTLSGDDAGRFSIDEPGGVLRFDLDPVPPKVELPPPDFERPADRNTDNNYAVTIQASVGATTNTLDASVSVTDLNEPGSVVLSSSRPSAGAALSATLNDPEGVTAGRTTWSWERSDGRNAWTAIEGAASADYTPGDVDSGQYLRAVVRYTDGDGAVETLRAVARNTVVTLKLRRLTVGGATRAMYPGFDPATLHYAVVCAPTLTLRLDAEAAGVRLAVNGRQWPSGSPETLNGLKSDSDIEIALSNGAGASTTYVVHCVHDDYPTVEVAARPGAWDGLMALNFGHRGLSFGHVALVDANGVPRLRRRFGHRVSHLSYHRDGKYPFHFFRRSTVGGSGLEAAILDGALNEVDRVTTVAPLTDTDGHGFVIRENGNYVLIAYEPVNREVRYFDTVRVLDLEDSVIQEVTPDGTQVFLWNSYDHMAIEDCLQHNFPGDWAHLNSLQVVDGGDIVASFRGCSQVLRISAGGGGSLASGQEQPELETVA